MFDWRTNEKDKKTLKENFSILAPQKTQELFSAHYDVITSTDDEDLNSNYLELLFLYLTYFLYLSSALLRVSLSRSLASLLAISSLNTRALQRVCCCLTLGRKESSLMQVLSRAIACRGDSILVAVEEW